MSTQQELADQLNITNAQIEKVGNETRSLLTKIQDLLDQLTNAPVSPELQAAADAVRAQVQVVDDLVPDLP